MLSLTCVSRLHNARATGALGGEQGMTGSRKSRISSFSLLLSLYPSHLALACHAHKGP